MAKYIFFTRNINLPLIYIWWLNITTLNKSKHTFLDISKKMIKLGPENFEKPQKIKKKYKFQKIQKKLPRDNHNKAKYQISLWQNK